VAACGCTGVAASPLLLVHSNSMKVTTSLLVTPSLIRNSDADEAHCVVADCFAVFSSFHFLHHTTNTLARHSDAHPQKAETQRHEEADRATAL